MTVRATSPRGRRRYRRGTATLVAAALLIPLVPVTLAVGATTVNAASTSAAYLDPSVPVKQRVRDLLGRMTLEEKVGQMTQAERGAVGQPELVYQLGLGSVLSGGGSAPTPNTPEAWADMVDGFQREALRTRLQHSDHLWRRCRARSRQCSWGNDLPAQHRTRCDPGCPACRAGGGCDGRGGPGDRHSVGLRAVHLRHPGRTLGP